MRKLRNFFLAVLGFFLLAVAFFIFSEVAWVDRGIAAAVASVEKTPTSAPEGYPSWLVPYEQIAFQCDHPWVVRRTTSLLDLGVDDISLNGLIDAGLSECYRLAGELAVDSHIWHQGIRSQMGDTPSLIEPSEKVELFFEHNADFQRLGLEAPETVSLSGTVVHDLNGDAVFNPGEPVISGAQICINRKPLTPLCVLSDPDGKYSFDHILPGSWSFRVTSPITQRLDEFKYTNQLIEADRHIPETTINEYTITERYLNLTEFNPIEDEILLLVDQDIEHNFFLMHEWATYFAALDNAEEFHTEAYWDYDVRAGKTRVFSGERGPTYDQHDGLDTICPRGAEIVSVAEGRVIGILYNSTVVVRHANQLISVYGHGDPLVEEDQYVPRGYPVALCNDNLTENGPHLHFAVWKNTPWLHRVNYGIPPFADLVITKEKWVANRDPLEKDFYVYLLQGGRGVWTEINQPHLPYVRIAGE